MNFGPRPAPGSSQPGQGPPTGASRGPSTTTGFKLGRRGGLCGAAAAATPTRGAQSLILSLSLPVRWAAVHRGTIAGLGRVLDLLSDIIYIYSKIISTLRGYKLYFMPVNGLLLDSEVTVPARKFGLVYA